MIDRVVFVYKWYLPTLSEIVALAEPDLIVPAGFPAEQQVKAERQWAGAVAALNQILQRVTERSAAEGNVDRQGAKPLDGVLLSGPFPVLNQSGLADRIATWMFTVAAPGEILQLLPSADDSVSSRYSKVLTLPLLPRDPLAGEQFCLALTSEFSLAMVLGETAEGIPAFLFSFDPEVSWQVWRSLEARIKLAAPHMLPVLQRVIEQFPAVAPDYRTVAQFSRLLLMHLPQPAELEGKPGSPSENPVFQEAGKSFVSLRPKTVPAAGERLSAIGKPQVGKGKPSHFKGSTTEQRREAEDRLPGSQPSADAELLQAIAHEVRTPLTTIRTLTRLLLRRKDLNPDVIKRLEVIDRECTEQIDRFNLFFRAVEIETTSARTLWTSLAPISLDQVLQQNIPRWQQQASQHKHTLDIMLPQKMPLVMTDPTMLDQALTGLIDRITHSLPPGSHIQVRVSLAGQQLKLQMESHPQSSHADGTKSSKFGFTPTLKSLGQLLMFQPETGNISLNLTATKNLFQALGGKLIVRQRPEEGEVLTIFLPLENRKE